jgi:hypothetical protein
MTDATSTILAMPKSIVSLASSGYIIKVRQRVMTFTKADAKIGAKVSSDAGADRTVGKFNHDLFAGDPHLRALLNHRQTVYNWETKRFYELDWSGSEHFCPIPMFAAILKEFDALKVEHAALKKAWGDAYDTAIARMAFVRGALFNRADYPSRDAMLAKFQLDMIVTEVPQGDYRNAIATETAEYLRADLERQAQGAITSMLDKQKAQLLTVLKSLSNCCELVTSTDKDGNVKTKRKKLYDSTVERAIELCSLFESFNLTGDADLEAARAGLAAALDGVSIDALKESDTLRTIMKEQVDDVLKTFAPKVSLMDEE